jgi:hypothetical protein
MQERGVYRLTSRNLALGVWDPDSKGFIGIREKFGHEYLDTEYHCDRQEFATARPEEFLGRLSDDRIRVQERFDSRCYYCGRDLFRDKIDGVWKARGNVGCVNGFANDHQSIAPQNQALFRELREFERA